MSTISMDSSVTLSNGVRMPMFGYNLENVGTKVYNIKTQSELLLNAIRLGFRYFDTAENYGGLRALARAIKKSGVPREDFFIASKMRIDEMGDGRYYQAIDETLMELETEYLDLYSIHWPLKTNRMWPELDAFVGAYVGREIKKTDNGDSDGLISLYNRGLTRAIGVCNMEIHHLEEIISNPKCTIIPMINQNQFHPLYTTPELREYCKDKGIVFGMLNENSELSTQTKPRIYTDVNRYGAVIQRDEDHIRANEFVRMNPVHRKEGIQPDPFDRNKNPRREHDMYEDFDEITAIARDYGKTNSQLVTRWSLQHGVVTTVKGLLPQQMKSDMEVFDFEITKADMEKLDSFNIGLRVGFNPDYIDF